MQLRAGGTRPRPGVRVLATLILLAGCSHSEALRFEHDPLDGPFEPNAPTQLTYNTLEDQFPTWLPDGTGITYTFRDQGNNQFDQCLGVLPAGGGQARRTACPINDYGGDSTDVFFQAAYAGDGRLAWMDLHNVVGRAVPDYGSILLGTLDPATPRQQLLRLPYVASSGNTHLTVQNLRWLSATQLAYIGADIVIRAPCQNCKPDSVVVPHEVMLLSASGGVPTVVPNTGEATSLWPDGSGGFYFTLAGDARVYRRNLGTGATDLVHDFVTGIARDVSVANGRLTATVGGNVSYSFEPLIGMRQIDSGGVVVAVDLASGAEQPLSLPGTLYRRGALSPDGSALVAEGFTAPSPNANLWLFQVE